MRTIITGMGHYLPEQIVTSEEIEERIKPQLEFSLSKGTIQKLSGVKERRHVTNGVHPSDLAFMASKIALEQAEVRPQDIDLIIFAACTKDVGEPATANILQDKLKASNASVFDAQNACNSFVNALDIADSFIRTGKCKTGLIASGEVLSAFIDWDIKKKKEMETGFAGLTLGDGGGAFVIKGTKDPNRGIQSTYFKSIGSLWNLATVMGGGTVAPRDQKSTYFKSRSKELLKFAFDKIPEVVDQFLKNCGWNPRDIDLIFPHQASEGIIRKVCKVTKIPFENCQFGLAKYGNTGAASIPIGLSEANMKGILKPDHKVLLVGGASGFSIGTISLIW